MEELQNLESIEGTQNVENNEEQQDERFAAPRMDLSAFAGVAEIQTDLEAQLQSEGLGVLDGQDLAPEGQDTPLYMGTPVSSGGSEGIDVPEQVENSEQEEADEEEPETAPEIPQSYPVLTAADTDLLYRIRELGGAATLWEVARYRGSDEADMDRITGGDFAENGDAFYREHRGHTVIALAGATESDLTKATNRAEAEEIGMRFESSMNHAHFTAWGMIQRLINLGGSGSLDGAKRHLNIHGFRPRSIRPVFAELHERGVIRVSVKGEATANGERDTRTRFLTLANAREGALANAAKRHAADEKEIPARRAEAAEKARKRGQSKAFVAPMVPFGGTRVTPEEQARALYIERAKARYEEAQLKGIQSVALKLAASGTTDTLQAEEVTLYTAEPNGAREFFSARVKGRILTGLSRYELLTGARILSVLFPEKGSEIVGLLSQGRELSPALAEPYTLFTEAVNELISEGRIQRTRKGLSLAPEKAAEKASAAKAAEVNNTEDWADQAPRPERQSGPDAHGADKYAADMAGAHDHRHVASGPQAPSTRPGQRRRTAKRIASAVRKAQEDPAKVKADSERAESTRAWNEARNLYSASLSPRDRLELYLQLEGEKNLERMVEGAEEPGELYQASVTLKDEGRITVRENKGYTLISATGELDRTELAESLIEVMVTEEIPVPAGTTLAARVHNAREELERSQAFAAVS